MGKTMITEDLFPEIVEQYNNGGKTAAYDLIRSRYGLKNPYFVITRIKKCGRYSYDPDTDQFSGSETETGDSVFMDLDELCGTSVVKVQDAPANLADGRPAAMEKLVHELISDRLLAISQYITMDPATRTVLIDQTSLLADG